MTDANTHEQPQGRQHCLTPHLPSLEQRLQPHALFDLSKFLYIFCVKVTHCQLAVRPVRILLYIGCILHSNLRLISLTSSLCVAEIKKEKENSSNRSSLIIISKIVRGFIHACLSLKANEGGLDCSS